jgi:hypothetical protein
MSVSHETLLAADDAVHRARADQPNPRDLEDSHS